MLDLEIIIKPELYDEKTGEFIDPVTTTIRLEHSLVSLSKWESKWHKPFLHTEKTDEEIMDYIKCMTLTQNVPDDVYNKLSSKNIQEIKDYIDNPMTATTFSENRNQKKSREIVTSELIYYWMVAYQIPFECQKWHLNRLITLTRICGIKNQPPSKNKTSQRELANRDAAINRQRRAQLHSKG